MYLRKKLLKFIESEHTYKKHKHDVYDTVDKTIDVRVIYSFDGKIRLNHSEFAFYHNINILCGKVIFYNAGKYEIEEDSCIYEYFVRSYKYAVGL